MLWDDCGGPRFFLLRALRSAAVSCFCATSATGFFGAWPDYPYQTLSENRAGAVVDYLVGTGVERERLAPVGYGPSIPRVAHEGADTHKNRRGAPQ